MLLHRIAAYYERQLERAPEAFEAYGRALRVACNQQMADPATPVTEGCELAFFPPVTGG